MPFSAFVAMISSGTIHFTRVDKFGDHFEGNWPKFDLKYWIKEQAHIIPSVTHSQKEKIAASCWIELDHESAGMWRLYVPDGMGIAITTTYEKLRMLMDSHASTTGVSLADAARVRYIDHFRDSLIQDLEEGEHLPNTLLPFMLKNISYQHEKEVRALISIDRNHSMDSSGCDLKVELGPFIEKIVIAPTAPIWFGNTVLRVCEKFEIENVLERSELARESFYATVVERGPGRISDIDPNT